MPKSSVSDSTKSPDNKPPAPKTQQVTSSGGQFEAGLSDFSGDVTRLAEGGGAQLTPGQVLQLQRKVGNQAVGQVLQRRMGDQAGLALANGRPHDIQRRPLSAGVVPTIQRVPPQGPQQPTTNERLNDVERRQRILAKQTQANAIDLRFRAMFGERVASYRQAIYRVTTGIDTATQGFQAAQIAQAQTDALKAQLIGAVATFGFALGFEWVFSRGLGLLGGRLNMTADRIKNLVEAAENPANALASGASNVATTAANSAAANAGQVPVSAGGSALSNLTSNLEVIEHHSQLIEQAFVDRSNTMRALNDEGWERFQPGAQEAQFQGLLTTMANEAKGIENMKPVDQVSLVLERRLWALWLQGLRANAVASDEAAKASGSGSLNTMGGEPEIASIGNDVEARLNQVGVSAQAGVVLTGHWYSGNSPSNWKRKLVDWAGSYNETLRSSSS
jgi:hypothetical protein